LIFSEQLILSQLLPLRTTPEVLVQEQLQNFVKAVAPEIPTLPEGSIHQRPKWGLSLAGCCGQARVAGHL
jgi:hypothetical protein